MSNILLTCSKATEYIERNRDRDLNIIQRIQLKMHLALCDFCRSYNRQTGQIHIFIQQFKKSKPSGVPDADKVKLTILQKVTTAKK